MYDELYADSLAADTADKLAQPISLQPADQGMLHNFFSGTAKYTMRGLAETGRAIDMAGAAWPVAMDAVTGGTKEQDAYFKTHDEIFNNAVDYWTPKPGDVGAASQVAGGLVSGVAQLLINPAVMVGTAQLSTAEDLNRQGVGAATANTVGGLAGVSTAVGIKLPYLGKTLAQKVGTGVAGNVAQGIVTRGAQGLTLRAAGYGEQAQQFDAWDIKSIALDAAMGAAFGALDYRATQAERDALLTMNQARHMERDTAPGLPVDATDLQKHTDAVTQAVEQVLRGEPVNVDATVEGMRIAEDKPLWWGREDVGREIAKEVFRDHYAEAVARAHEKLTKQMEAVARNGSNGYEAASQRAMDKFRAQFKEATRPIEVTRPAIDTAPPEPVAKTDAPATKPAAEPTPAEAAALPAADPLMMESQRALAENPDLTIPTGDVNPDGSAQMVRGADAIAKADAEVADIQSRAPGLFQSVAHCLLGLL